MANASNGSFWSSIPGMLTGTATLVTAIGGLLIAKPTSEKPTTVKSVQESEECAIKGNISQTPEGTRKIYHLPTDNGYQATKVDTGRGEKWFCSEIEAQKAGWKRAKQQ